MTSVKGDVLAQARRLYRRGQTGKLSATRVRLAAHLGDEAARVVLRQPARHESQESPYYARRALRLWLGALQSWGREVWVRAAVVAAREGLVDWELRHPTDQSPRAALEAATRWLSCPCAEHAAEASAAAAGASHAALDFAASAPIRAARAAAALSDAQSLEFATLCAEDAAWVTSPEHIRVRIRRALAPWALGYATRSSAA